MITARHALTHGNHRSIIHPIPMPSKPTPPKPHGLAGRTGRRANASKLPSEKAAASIRFRCTTDEENRYAAAAKKSNKSLSRWIRDTLSAAS
jgi:hypothetical protein